MSAIALALSTALSSAALGPVYVGAGGPIPDATTSNNIAASGLFTSSVNVTEIGQLTSIKVVTLTNMTHTFVGDLQVALISPTGTRVNLFSRFGVTTATGFGSGTNLGGNYAFTDGLGDPAFSPAGTTYAGGVYNRITNTNAAVVQIGTISGVQGVNNNTYATLAGENVNGNWTLEVRDFAAADTGALGSWSLDFNYVPAPGALALLGLAGIASRRRRA